MDDQTTYHKTDPGHPLIRGDRWYIANAKHRAVVVDQPMVGFESEGAARMYARNRGPYTDTSELVAVPGTAVTG